MLLVVTNKTDLASDYLIMRLRERDIPFHRLNTEDFGSRFHVEIEVGPSPVFRLTVGDGRVLSGEDVSGVYFRQPRAPSVPEGVAVSDAAFVRREMKETLRSLWRIIDERRWLNHPRNLILASNKVEQLTAASSLGFLIPETVVTASGRRVREFYDVHPDGIVCKAVKHGFNHEDDVVTLALTRRVTPEFLSRFDDFASVPMIYQREIRKVCDIRVTVVGARVYATAIHSQDRRETEVDWRAWDPAKFHLRHEAMGLPAEVEEACRAVTARFGLRYSAIDLVEADDGQFYFLELNPNGQWAWIEQQTGQPIRDAIIDELQS